MKEFLYILLHIFKYNVMGWLWMIVAVALGYEFDPRFWYVMGAFTSLAVDFLSDKYKNKKK